MPHDSIHKISLIPFYTKKLIFKKTLLFFFLLFCNFESFHYYSNLTLKSIYTLIKYTYALTPGLLWITDELC